MVSQVPQNQLKSGSTSEPQSQPRPAPTPQPCTATEVAVASPGTPPTPAPRRSLMKNDEKTQVKTSVTRLNVFLNHLRDTLISGICSVCEIFCLDDIWVKHIIQK